jgi:TRAP-type C4-dicarboxylate transport system permease small subunit
MNLHAKLSRFFDRATGLLAALAAVVIFFMTGIVCWDVASRFFLGYGLGWTLEVVEYGMLWFTLLASAWVLKRERHVKIDIVLLRLNPRAQGLVNIITSILAAVACLVVTVVSADLTIEYVQTGERLPTQMMPPKFLPYLVIPVGFAFLFVQFARRAYGYWKPLKELREKMGKSKRTSVVTDKKSSIIKRSDI